MIEITAAEVLFFVLGAGAAKISLGIARLLVKLLCAREQFNGTKRPTMDLTDCRWIECFLRKYVVSPRDIDIEVRFWKSFSGPFVRTRLMI